MMNWTPLVGNCSKFYHFNLCIKPRYTHMLLEFDDSLCRLLQILRVQSARYLKRNLVLVREMQAKITGDGGNTAMGLDHILSRLSSIASQAPQLTEDKGIHTPTSQVRSVRIKYKVRMLKLM